MTIAFDPATKRIILDSDSVTATELYSRSADWLEDLVRNGLASVETQPASFWEGQAKRLVDAQAPGLAGRVRRLAALPHATPDWTARLLDDLGRLALLTHAFRRVDQLDPALQEDVRGLIGWSLSQDIGRAVRAIAEDRFPFSTGACFDVDGGFHLHRL